MEHVAYKWSDRTSSKVSAQVVGETIEQIAARDGACTPYRLVDEAMPQDSPLHSLFTWNEKEAATNWRVSEARNLIAGLTIMVERREGAVRVPAFVSVGRSRDSDAPRGYRPISVVQANPDFRQEAIDDALSQLKALERRYHVIEGLSPVWDAIDQVSDRVAKKPKHLKRAA